VLTLCFIYSPVVKNQSIDNESIMIRLISDKFDSLINVQVVKSGSIDVQ